MATDPTPPTKTLEQVVEEYPHVQFFRDMLGMQRDAIKEREAHFEQHWSSIGGHLKISTAGPSGPFFP
jgi:hypothetical protein